MSNCHLRELRAAVQDMNVQSCKRSSHGAVLSSNENITIFGVFLIESYFSVFITLSNALSLVGRFSRIGLGLWLIGLS
ncbi:hypothetical protein EON65_19130 [archaeon]|nr:MAG: hypothetical protein EON65_19130 [archaeon]